jgi:DNA invertase Pin-like site-specific DNA recombinase
MDLYAIYLRNRQVDVEAEQADEELTKQETVLMTLAKERQYSIGETYRESGVEEDILQRPEMQRLLTDVEAGKWKGVLVAEEELLAQEGTIDQGRVQQAFYYSHTLIITPNQVYNPDSDMDQDYFAFGLFLSRREHKMVNRRLHRGRMASVMEGKWIGGQVPFGYEKVDLENEKGKTLKPIPEQAEIVRAVFDWYVVEDIAITTIAARLNDMGLRTAKGQMFTVQSIRTILDNPVYSGMIRCGSRKVEKISHQGKLVDYHYRVPDEEGVNLFPGRHEALVSRELFQAAKKKRENRKGIPGPKQLPLMNPFAGLIYCSRCGRVMMRNKGKPGAKDRLWCPYPGCIGEMGVSTIPDVEVLLLQMLQQDLKKLRIPEERLEEEKRQESSLSKELDKLQQVLNTVVQQKSNAFDLVERGVYTPEVFTMRMEELARREASLKEQIKDTSEQLEKMQESFQQERELPAKLKRVIDLYPVLDSAEEKNKLLKTVIARITYLRPTRSGAESIQLKIQYLL